MHNIVLTIFIILTNLPSITPCTAEHKQCNRAKTDAVIPCCPPSTCKAINSRYAQCRTETASASSSSGTRSTSTQCNALNSQCGGESWRGSTCCMDSICAVINQNYSQCLKTSSSSTTTISKASTFTTKASTSTTKTSTPSTANDGRANGVTTRYWDCCKASCEWAGKAPVKNPVKTCAKDGITSVDASTQSVCNGGTAYMCNNQQPWNVSSQLSYAYAAANITGQGESNWCCACYSLIFTTTSIAGKELIVQVTNTSGDLGNNHFALQMPGGGFGIFDGCTSQFGGSYLWGQKYGGVSQRSDCSKLPSVLQSGCFWRFDWFQNADNPQIRFKQITCPTVLTANTNCVRQ